MARDYSREAIKAWELDYVTEEFMGRIKAKLKELDSDVHSLLMSPTDEGVTSARMANAEKLRLQEVISLPKQMINEFNESD